MELSMVTQFVMFYLLLFLFGQIYCVELRKNRLLDWDYSYTNVHCRDDDNAPVDWWILYKPPRGALPGDEGLNFSYISSAAAGSWVPSERPITGVSMLRHTLAPMFRETYQEHVAVLTYSPQPPSARSAGSAAAGALLADQLGGVWLAHSLPGLADDGTWFPLDELRHGHVLACLSAGHVTLNELAQRLRELQPRVLRASVPAELRDWLPDWLPMRIPIRLPLNHQLPHRTYSFVSKRRTLRAQVVVRRPGDSSCLYRTFANTHSIVLDVYGHHNLTPAVCGKDYGIRKIDAISLNYPNYINDDTRRSQVVYVEKQNDRLQFAVSAAPRLEPWACVGSSGLGHAAGKGGLILCIQGYDVWRSFDILKIKEPEC